MPQADEHIALQPGLVIWIDTEIGVRTPHRRFLLPVGLGPVLLEILDVLGAEPAHRSVVEGRFAPGSRSALKPIIDEFLRSGILSHVGPERVHRESSRPVVNEARARVKGDGSLAAVLRSSRPSEACHEAATLHAYDHPALALKACLASGTTRDIYAVADGQKLTLISGCLNCWYHRQLAAAVEPELMHREWEAARAGRIFSVHSADAGWMHQIVSSLKQRPEKCPAICRIGTGETGKWLPLLAWPPCSHCGATAVLEDMPSLAPPCEPYLEYPAFLMDPRVGWAHPLEARGSPDSSGVYVHVATSTRVMPAGADQSRFVCAGRGLDPDTSRRSAIGELLERCCSLTWGRPMVRASYVELGTGAVDPQDFATPDAPADVRARPLRWVVARAVDEDTPVLVPAASVYLDGDPASAGEPLAVPTSSGLAAGEDLQAAILSAGFEVLERDAWMCAWLQRRRGQSLPVSTHPCPWLRQLPEKLREDGIELHLSAYPTLLAGTSLVVCSLITRNSWPAAVIGLGAADVITSAAQRAAMEACQMHGEVRRWGSTEDNRKRAEALLSGDLAPSQPMDHGLRFAPPGAFRDMEFLLESPAAESFEWPSTPSQDAASKVLDVARSLRLVGFPLLFVELTLPDCHRMGFRVVRALIPGTQAVSFGPVTGIRRSRALRMRMAEGEPLNPCPHPLA